MMILHFVAPYDTILNNEDAYWDADNNEMYSSDRYLALREFNKHGYRVLQFVSNRYAGSRSEWVLVERSDIEYPSALKKSACKDCQYKPCKDTDISSCEFCPG